MNLKVKFCVFVPKKLILELISILKFFYFNFLFSKPKDNKLIASGELKPLEREFVIDIDLTDYDEVRNCCKFF